MKVNLSIIVLFFLLVLGCRKKNVMNLDSWACLASQGIDPGVVEQFFQDIKNNNLAEVRGLLDGLQEGLLETLLSCCYQEEATPLHAAAANGHPKEAKDDLGRTPLHWAARARKGS